MPFSSIPIINCATFSIGWVIAWFVCCQVTNMYRTWLVGAFEYRTLSLVIRWIRISGVRYSDHYCIQITASLTNLFQSLVDFKWDQNIFFFFVISRFEEMSFWRFVALDERSLQVRQEIGKLVACAQAAINNRFFIYLSPEFLPVSGPLTRWCASTFGTALLCSSRIWLQLSLPSRRVIRTLDPDLELLML